MAGVALCLCLLAIQLFLRHRGNRYRRAGLELLGEARTNQEISTVLKRVALAAFARHEVASLYGRQWVDFLNATCEGAGFGADLYEDPEAEGSAQLVHSARRWISKHTREKSSQLTSAEPMRNPG